MSMKIEKTKIPDVLILTPKGFDDERGFFMESYNQNFIKSVGIKLDFVQDNHSKSSQGVIRGLHFQKKNPQGMGGSPVLIRGVAAGKERRRLSRCIGIAPLLPMG